MSLNENESEDAEPAQETSTLFCVQQGDRICYNDIGNKQTIKTIQSENGTTVDSLDIDSIHSGESLFKTFSFNIKQDSDPDLKKCLTFWKTILKNNVKPVKCSLLKHSRVKEIKEKKPQQTNICDMEQTQKMWMTIYEDLQRRKLDKVKMGKKQKCNPCDDYIDEEDLKRQEREDIKKLNTWISQPTGKTDVMKRIDINAQMKRALNALNKASTSQKSSLINTEKLSKEPSVKEMNFEKRSEILSRPSSRTSTPKPPSEDLETKSDDEIAPEPCVEDVCEACNRPVEECDESTESVTDVLLEASQLCESPTDPVCGAPCDCVKLCECEVHQDQEACRCGCLTGDCDCQELRKVCVCGCDQEECICERHDEEQDCGCGCGLDDCLCQQLFTKSCNCGHDDCNCDLVGIISNYLGTTSTPLPKIEEASPPHEKNTAMQTDVERRWTTEPVPEMGATYCVICGHYNCFCNMKRTSV